MKTASVFDIAEYLDSKEMIQGYLEEDANVFMAAVQHAVRAIKIH